MADQSGNDTPQTEGAPKNTVTGKVVVEAQYIKDLSFENPLGPESARAAIRGNPDINVEVTSNAHGLGDDRYEVTLFIRGEAKAGDQTVFIIEVTYGGAFNLAGVPQEAIAPLLLVEGAQLLFPFVRNIVAEVTSSGGYPPLMIAPMDFVALFREQHMGGANGGNGAGKGGDTT